MGCVIAYGDADWFVANYEFRLLLGLARTKVECEDDTQVLARAEALHGLFLDSLPDEQLRRLVRALRSATNELHDAHHAPRDDRESGFRNHLVVLSDLLDGVPR
jgi:hypothetical protein